MKKFVTTLAALFAALALSVGFTACGDGENPEGYEQVTKTQWEAALDLFTDDLDEVNADNLNLSVQVEYEFVEGDRSGTVIGLAKIDYANKACSYEDNSGYKTYTWEDSDGVVSGYYDYTRSKSRGNVFTKDESFLKSISDFMNDCTSIGYVMFDVEALDNFEKFEYDSKSGGFKYNESNNNNTSDLTLYFRNSKLEKIELVFSDADSPDYEKWVETFTYGNTTVTVPDEIKYDYEVSDGQWAAALNLFSGDKEKVNLPDLVFKCSVVGINEVHDNYENQILEVDYKNKVIHLAHFNENNETILEFYFWQEGDKFYNYGDKDNDGIIDKEEVDAVSENIDMVFLTYSSAGHLGELYYMLDLAEKFSDFTFDEETNSYHAALQTSDYAFDVTLYFLNGKLTEAKVLMSDGEKTADYSINVTYGNSITIPQEVKDYPLSIN